MDCKNWNSTRSPLFTFQTVYIGPIDPNRTFHIIDKPWLHATDETTSSNFDTRQFRQTTVRCKVTDENYCRWVLPFRVFVCAEVDSCSPFSATRGGPQYPFVFQNQSFVMLPAMNVLGCRGASLLKDKRGSGVVALTNTGCH